MDFQVFHQGKKWSDYKSCNDFFRLPKAVTKKIDECGGTIVVEFKGKYKRHALEIMKQIVLP